MPKNKPAQQAHATHSKHGTSAIPNGGEMGRLIRSYDWAHTELGEIESWPASLLTATNILLESPVPIVMLWGKDGIMLYNDAYSVFAGKRHPQLLGSKVIEGWPEVADFNRNVMKTCLGGKTLSYKDQKLTLYRNDVPEQVWMDLNYSPIIDGSGKPAGVWAIVIETTQRVFAEQLQRQAEEDLDDERKRLQSIFTQAPALIAVLRGPEFVFEMANPMYLQTVAPNRDVVGKPMLEALPELAGQGIIEILQDVLKTGRPYVGELAAKIDPNNTGELADAYFNLVYQPISSEGTDTADGIFVHAVDITEQVLSRRYTEELNAQLEAVFDSIPDGLYFADAVSNKITRINQRGAEVLGYSSPEKVPRDLAVLYKDLSLRHMGTKKNVGLENSTIGNALQGKPVQHYGIHVHNPVTGREHILRTAGAPIRDKKGKVIGAVAINNDLTEYYDLQAKIQKDAIKRRLLSQKAKLLKEQNAQLTRLNTTKDEFIALTSHQLRTPATGVKQYIAMLLQGYAGPLSSEQKEYLERAYEGNERQLHIIEDILRIAKLDLGQLRIQKQQHDLTKIVTKILAEQANSLTERKQKLVTDFPDTPLPVMIDAGQLHMAIANIIDNAIKYTPDDKHITVRLKRGAHKSAQLEITDEGVGIAEEDLAKLFLKFSRIPNSRSIEVGGTGLGLYWSKRIIALHEGTIDVASEPGKGTTFVITLPVLR